MYLNENRGEKGKHLPRAAGGILLGFASDSNTSDFPPNSKTLISNQVRFDETKFPYRKQSVVDRHIEDELVNILKEAEAVIWESYNKSLQHGSYEQVQYDPTWDELVLKVEGQHMHIYSIQVSWQSTTSSAGLNCPDPRPCLRQQWSTTGG